MTAKEIPPLQRSPHLAGMEDAREKIEIAEMLADHGRNPALAEYVLSAEGDDPEAKVRTFEKMWDTALEKAVNTRMNGGRSSPNIPGCLSGQDFLSMAAEAQDESTPVEQRDRLISEMIDALKSGRVR
jgi:hypothetical protein